LKAEDDSISGSRKRQKPGQIYLIVDFAKGRTTWVFIVKKQGARSLIFNLDCKIKDPAL
jgi:hypothetical protein